MHVRMLAYVCVSEKIIKIRFLLQLNYSIIQDQTLIINSSNVLAFILLQRNSFEARTFTGQS